MTNRPGRDSDKLLVRFPDGMKAEIEKAAKANGRSLNAEVVARLERSFDADPTADLAHRVARIEKMLEQTEAQVEQSRRQARRFKAEAEDLSEKVEQITRAPNEAVKQTRDRIRESIKRHGPDID